LGTPNQNDLVHPSLEWQGKPSKASKIMHHGQHGQPLAFVKVIKQASPIEFF
jgi:hypothetical protein